MFAVEYQDRQSVIEISMKCPIIENISVTPKIVQVEFDKNSITHRSFSVILTHASHDQSVLKSPPNTSKLPNDVSLKNISNLLPNKRMFPQCIILDVVTN
jgi:hypothetical protein